MSLGTISIVTPAYEESKNLPLLYGRIKSVLDPLGLDWEWVIIDDHSKDDTFAVAAELAEKDSRVHVSRLSRNSGSHVAIACGFERCKGAVAIMLAADLQDPPEVIPQLLEKWRTGSQVVWAVREARLGETRRRVFMARMYYRVLQKIMGNVEIPATGADFFLLDRVVIDSLVRFKERNTNILALIAWMGFRTAYISYVKEARVFGESSWGLKKNLKLAKDSVTSFTAFPLRLMSYIGFFVAAVGMCYAMLIIVWAIIGHPVQGWSSLMVVCLVLGGTQLLMLGVLGEYLWSALDEVRARPRYLIEDASRGGAKK